MATVLLKNGSTVQVAVEDLPQFIQDNKENIVVRRVKRIGNFR